MNKTLSCIAIFATCSCAPTAEDIKTEFQEFVEENSSCSSDSDCTLVQPGCPIGCWASVEKDAASEAESLAKDLISQYEKRGEHCEYDCESGKMAVCAQKKCAVIDEEQ